MVAPRWTESSWKHGIDRLDQVFALANATFVDELDQPETDGGRVRIYIGPRHSQTDDEIELLVKYFPDGREAVVFHAMRLGPKYRRYREEHSDGFRS
ncbi:hypothetical protein [Subtercola endophyticus]|uniref:hypothetical protein n=1 Tax=Subtercola endophyticus TaxID=2895559 RepID=UPI001E2FFF44|nr:hypothetical protein [Subtercola endophyticus]UFS59696.1 hypothetical protein LQ955_02530 [Subtercola endophyticus]